MKKGINSFVPLEFLSRQIFLLWFDFGVNEAVKFSEMDEPKDEHRRLRVACLMRKLKMRKFPIETRTGYALN